MNMWKQVDNLYPKKNTNQITDCVVDIKLHNFFHCHFLALEVPLFIDHGPLLPLYHNITIWYPNNQQFILITSSDTVSRVLI